MAEAYDELRVLPAVELKQKFSEFETQFLSAIQLSAQKPASQQSVSLSLSKVDIPEPGYTKVPRISTIWLTGQLPPDATSISLIYPGRFSDYAVRVRQVDLDAEKWHWSSWDWVKSERPSEMFSLTEIYGPEKQAANHL